MRDAREAHEPTEIFLQWVADLRRVLEEHDRCYLSDVVEEDLLPLLSTQRIAIESRIEVSQIVSRLDPVAAMETMEAAHELVAVAFDGTNLMHAQIGISPADLEWGRFLILGNSDGAQDCDPELCRALRLNHYELTPLRHLLHSASLLLRVAWSALFPRQRGLPAVRVEERNEVLAPSSV